MFKPPQEYPPMNAEEVGKLYSDAVLYFRNLVELDGIAPADALGRTLESYALGLTLESCVLGLNQRGKLEDEVAKRYDLKEGI